MISVKGYLASGLARGSVFVAVAGVHCGEREDGVLIVYRCRWIRLPPQNAAREIVDEHLAAGVPRPRVAVPHRGLGGEASTKIDPTRQPTTIPTHMNAVGAFAIKALRANYAGQRRCEDPLCKDEECEVVSGSSQQEDTEPGGSGWVWVVVAVVVVVGARARVCVYASSTVSA